jgi:hypothetical protein
MSRHNVHSIFRPVLEALLPLPGPLCSGPLEPESLTTPPVLSALPVQQDYWDLVGDIAREAPDSGINCVGDLPGWLTDEDLDIIRRYHAAEIGPLSLDMRTAAAKQLLLNNVQNECDVRTERARERFLICSATMTSDRPDQHTSIQAQRVK